MTKCDTCGVTYGRERSFFCNGDTPHKWFTVGEKATEPADTTREALVKARRSIESTAELMKMLWTYLAAIQMQDINSNEGTERFRQVRGYYYQLSSALSDIREALKAIDAEEQKDAN